jgi:AcrR family transcriptional regulator
MYMYSMPRAALTEHEIAETREQICAAAAGLFAEHGYAGVTLRGIAAELGCSPMTPYRYFDDKAAIFEAVRAAAFERFADTLEAGAGGARDPEQRLARLGDAYVRFAIGEPSAYRIMFQLDQEAAPGHADPPAQEGRAWRVLGDAVAEAIDAGAIAGERDTLAHLFWAGLHGLASLHLANKLQLGRNVASLIRPMMQGLLDGTRPRLEGDPDDDRQ